MNDNFAIMFHHEMKKIKLYDNYFRKVFGFSLKNCYSSNALEIATFGFDIVKFNNLIKVPDNKSVDDFVKEKYGEKGSELINNLLK